jgi:DNA processing protein
LLKDLAALFPDVLVISGLAYGIDVCAHRYALASGLPTVGVLAHGLDRIYPAVHRNMALEMLEGGGLLTDFVSGTTPDRENFLQRNRIIAGLADATVVVESGAKGGALITADIAFSYGRDVYAFPGRTTDEHSKGCNQLVRINKAGLITSARDLILALQWDTALTSPVLTQTTLPFETKKTDHPILALFVGKSEIHINEMALRMNLPVHQLLPLLFDLEMDGHLKALPGGIYKPNG